MSTPAGGSPRVLTTVSEDDSRVKWLCHRYVGSTAEFGLASDGTTIRDLGITADLWATKCWTRADNICRLALDQTRRLAT